MSPTTRSGGMSVNGASGRQADVEWNKEGRPVNWNGRDWQLYKRQMMRYLGCYKVENDEWPLDSICDGSVQLNDMVFRPDAQAYRRQDRLLGMLISSSLSCTLARQVMRFESGAAMWDYLSKRFEGRENATTKLYTQRTLRNKLEMASCRPGADVENHLIYMLSLREQLAALDADVSDVWMVDLMLRSMSQFSYYEQLQTLMFLGGLQTLSTPDEAKAMILTLDRNAQIERQTQARRDQSRGEQRGGNGGKRPPATHNRNQSQPEHRQPGSGAASTSSAAGRHNGGRGITGEAGDSRQRRQERIQQHYQDRDEGNCYGCHQPGHIKRNCPNNGSNGAERADGEALLTTCTTATQATGQEQKAESKKGNDATLRPSIPQYEPGCWVFDCAANRHLVGDKRYFVQYRELTGSEQQRAVVRGYSGSTVPIGVGTADIWVRVDDELVLLRLENVFFSPEHQNLLSQSEAHGQGFDVEYNNAKRRYTLLKNGVCALKSDMHRSGLWVFQAKNKFIEGGEEDIVPSSMVNFALSDGVADLQCWHDRLGHLCPQFIKKMADEGLVKGMTLRKRQFDMCEACQLGKQRAKSPSKQLDRGVNKRNQLVFADLFFPPKNYNNTRFTAVLVIMDAHTRYLTVYPLKTKLAEEVNPLMRRYVQWVDRQWPQERVKEVFTDGGGEFGNDEMLAWYQSQGITYTPTPPNTSRLNMVERTHQTLAGMMKAMLKESGLPTSFWVDALHYAAYIKNRTYSAAIEGIPYEAMWGRTPDIHHLRKFGALAYVHTKVGASRHKFADNCRVGFVLGYREGQLGCKVYFPTDHKVQYAGQVTVNEQILYRDRHEGETYEEAVGQWASDEYPDLTTDGRRDYDIPIVGGRRRQPPSQTTSTKETEEDENKPPRSATWLQRGPPEMGDEMVFVVDASSHCPRSTEEAPLAPESGEEPLPVSSEGRKPGLVEVGDDADSELDDEGFAIYAAVAYVTLMAEVEENGERKWHSSEIRLPRSEKEAMNSPQRRQWWKGMEREIATMIEKEVLELIPESEIPEGKRILETMWRFQFKTDDLGNVVRFRPRLCARGDRQEPGIDFMVGEIFSPVARMASFRLFVAICVLLELDIFQCDINTAYLNAKLKIIHYIRRIAGFPIKKGYAYKVNNALYGLHQSGKEWNEELHKWLTGRGWRQSLTEPCMYSYREGGVTALLLVYVDDLVCGTNDENWKKEFFADLNEKYGIKDQGRLHNYLGIQVESDSSGVFLHQAKYAREVLQRFGFEGAHGCRSPMETNLKLHAASEGEKGAGIAYRAAVGSLMYLATSTRPDLAYCVGYLSRFTEHPSCAHGGAVKRVLRYLAATVDRGIYFSRATNEDQARTLKIAGFCDADWGNCPDTRKSVSGYVMTVAGGPVAWAARRQSIVAQSTAEAEYVAACEACQEGRALSNILMEVVPDYSVKFTLGIDNQAALALADRPTYSRKTRHIELRYHYVREQVAQGAVELWKIDGSENPADLFTKPLNSTRLGQLTSMIGMQPKMNTTPREDRRAAFAQARFALGLEA